MNDDAQQMAEQRGRKLITESGWDVVATLKSHPISEASYSGDANGREYFEQALTDGEVAVIHPIGRPPGDQLSS